MSTSECFYLVSADAALRAAILEQWQSSALAGMVLQEAESLTSSLSPLPAAIIVDVSSADKKIIGLLREWHAHEKKPKIFLLGDIKLISKSDEDDNLVSESFSKPLRLGHLLARLQFHMQPARAQVGPLLFGDFRLEPALRQVIAGPTGAVIRLTEKETHLLEYLGRKKHPIAREELLAAIWGYDARIDTHTLETHIYRLRRKLDPEGKHVSAIIAEPGAYRLAAQTK